VFQRVQVVQHRPTTLYSPPARWSPAPPQDLVFQAPRVDSQDLVVQDYQQLQWVQSRRQRLKTLEDPEVLEVLLLLDYPQQPEVLVDLLCQETLSDLLVLEVLEFR